jgi:hypothetical protein
MSGTADSQNTGAIMICGKQFGVARRFAGLFVKKLPAFEREIGRRAWLIYEAGAQSWR